MMNSEMSRRISFTSAGMGDGGAGQSPLHPFYLNRAHQQVQHAIWQTGLRYPLSVLKTH